MYWLVASVAAVTFVCGMTASAAKAECRRAVVACESTCADQQNDTVADCMQSCRSIIVCEAEPRRSAKSHLPDSDLPADRLPNGRLPIGHLPEDSLPN